MFVCMSPNFLLVNPVYTGDIDNGSNAEPVFKLHIPNLDEFNINFSKP